MGKKNKKGQSGQDDLPKSTEPRPQSSNLKPQEKKSEQAADNKPVVKKDGDQKKVWDKPAEAPKTADDARQSKGDRRWGGNQRPDRDVSRQDQREADKKKFWDKPAEAPKTAGDARQSKGDRRWGGNQRPDRDVSRQDQREADQKKFWDKPAEAPKTADDARQSKGDRRWGGNQRPSVSRQEQREAGYQNLQRKVDQQFQGTQNLGDEKHHKWERPTGAPNPKRGQQGGPTNWGSNQRPSSSRQDQREAGYQHPQRKVDQQFGGPQKLNEEKQHKWERPTYASNPKREQQEGPTSWRSNQRPSSSRQDQRQAGYQQPSEETQQKWERPTCAPNPKREQQEGPNSSKPDNKQGGQVPSSTPVTKSDKINSKDKRSLNFDAISPKSQKGGTKGRIVPIETNYMKLNLSKLNNTTAYHYDVEFTPEKVPKRFYGPAMEYFCLKYYPNRYPGFDGRKNLYSSKPLFDSADMEGEVDIDDENGRVITFKIKIQLANLIDLSTLANYVAGEDMEKPQGALQCLDIVCRHAPSMVFTRVGRSFFSPPAQIMNLTGGMELWHGLFMSTVLGSQPFINVDVANKAFPIEQPVTQLLLELMSSGFRGPQQDSRSALETELPAYISEKLKSFIKGLKIKHQIPQKVTTRRFAKVLNVVRSARKERFKLDDNREMTVEEYFCKEKDYKLRYPNLPCLHIGNPKKKIYIPAELCTVVGGQVINKKLDEEQTTKMIFQTKTTPNERKQKIMSTVNKLNFNSNPCMKEFGLEMDLKFIEVNSRVLDAPSLRYFDNDIRPRDGAWRASKFYKSSEMIKWTILNLDRFIKGEDLKYLENIVKSKGMEMGMYIENPQVSCTLDSLRQNDVDKYLNDCQNRQIDLVFIVLPSRQTSDAYCMIKQTAELRCGGSGVLTQCVKSKTLKKLNPNTVSNILLKVNAKLNGTNHVLKTLPRILQTEACMIVGADVTHPSPDQQSIPSVAAVVASCDLNGAVYNAQLSLQDPKMEIIEKLGSNIQTQLRIFQERNKKLPTSILFYRDGVSEGQFYEVQQKEISAIKKACLEVSPNYAPRITFLVVQKRHHTRFFPIRKEDADYKTGNVKPGTVVDSVITFPNKMDFYLCSHASIQGVSRPARYCVLLNEHNFVEDDLEELTYYLCHLYTRCTRTVSYPAPTYYAHLAAFRARHYIYGKVIDMENLKASEKRFLNQNDFHKNNPMFFV